MPTSQTIPTCQPIASDLFPVILNFTKNTLYENILVKKIISKILVTVRSKSEAVGCRALA